MVFYDLLYNGQTNTAAAGCRVARRIRAVKPVENIWQISCGNTSSVVLDLHLNKVTDILDADIDKSLLFIQILDGIADNIDSDKIYQNKKYINKLNVGETFVASYDIEII